MIKNPNKFKNKFITIALSVFFTALFVFIGANASFLGKDVDGVEGLRVNGGSVIDGGLEIGKGLDINQNAIKVYDNSYDKITNPDPNFSVKADGVINSPTIREMRGVNLNCDKGMTLAKKWNAQTWTASQMQCSKTGALGSCLEWAYPTCSVKEGWAMSVATPSCLLGNFGASSDFVLPNGCIGETSSFSPPAGVSCGDAGGCETVYVLTANCYPQNWSDVICIGE